MPKFKIVSNLDPNVYFEVEGKYAVDAYLDALNELGYSAIELSDEFQPKVQETNIHRVFNPQPKPEKRK